MQVKKLILYLARTKWRIFKPITIGARVIIIKDYCILLVKHTYQDQYYLPGGMVKKKETFEQAARREIKEEIALELKELKLFGVYNNFYEHKSDTITVFLCTEFNQSDNYKVDNEVEHYAFYKFDNLPKSISPGTKRRIEEFLKGNLVNFGLW